MEPLIPYLPMIGAFAYLIYYAGVCRGDDRASKYYADGYLAGLQHGRDEEYVSPARPVSTHLRKIECNGRTKSA